MRTHVISPDAAARIDGTVQSMLLDHFPNRVDNEADCDVVLIPVARQADFKFNERLRGITKPYALIDYLEFEWCVFNTVPETHLLGKNTARFAPWLDPFEEWTEFSEFVRDHPPTMYFKRELLSKDASSKVKPLEWPCYLEIPPIQTEAEFNARPIECFFNWGYSHPSRPKLHGDVFRAMATHGIEVISDFAQSAACISASGGKSRIWASIYSPYYSRWPIAEVMRLQQQSKISVSLAGCGFKSFRHSEAPAGAVMALQDNDLAWAYPWDDTNSVAIVPGGEFHSLVMWTRYQDLYQIYVQSQETVAKYQSKRYIEEYLTPAIEASL